MKYPLIVYRKGTGWTKEEENAAKEYFTISSSRNHIFPKHLVIGRYSVLPFYKEFERDVGLNGGCLINSYEQHRYIANIFDWYEDLKDYTPKTWRSVLSARTEGYEDSFVIKGETNSQKFLWDTHMYCKDFTEVGRVLNNLLNDSLIGQQSIALRQYVPLITYMKSLHGLPITKEFRIFVAYGNILCGAFYWASHYQDLLDKGITPPDFEEVPKDFLNKIINLIGNKSNFYVIDVAQTKSGEWIVIELNDGQMSGLSMNNPEILYKNLRQAFKDNYRTTSNKC